MLLAFAESAESDGKFECEFRCAEYECEYERKATFYRHSGGLRKNVSLSGGCRAVWSQTRTESLHTGKAIHWFNSPPPGTAGILPASV